jgi:hypothetical protein
MCAFMSSLRFLTFCSYALQNPRKSITLASPDSGAEEEKKRTGNGGELQRINSAMNLSMKDYMKGYATASSVLCLRVTSLIIMRLFCG